MVSFALAIGGLPRKGSYCSQNSHPHLGSAKVLKSREVTQFDKKERKEEKEREGKKEKKEKKEKEID